MVKGVNKRVIEVNDTGNKYFEKIVFYVTPKYCDLSPIQLKQATEFLNLGFEPSVKNIPLRKRRRLRKKRIAVCALIGTAVVGLLATLVCIL